MTDSAASDNRISYQLSYGSFGQFVSVNVFVNRITEPALEVFFSAWRPGRYELGNFSKNVRHFNVTASSGESLSFVKISKDTWKINTDGFSSLVISYEYYAVRPDAGSCWLDNDIFYINPVHCCIGIKGMEHLPCNVIFNLPDGFKTATAMKQTSEDAFVVSDFNELVDSPVLASPSLQHSSYRVNEIEFHLWFYGTDSVPWEKVIHDFRAFTQLQINTMGDFPVEVYHFLILALPFSFYHGVEHLKSTVLALGPADELMTDKLYPELTGVASHELFHVWNVKTIRPAEMQPYNYHGENYSASGWVYEGITTYYGDLFLARTGFFSHESYFAELAARLQKHLDNPGKNNYSILESSFDTWLDGYEPGVPGRKTSIYDEGSLIALMFDLFIRKNNPGHSLDDFMRKLYRQFGKTGRGYTPLQLLELLKETAGDARHSFFEELLSLKGSYLSVLKKLFENLAVEIKLEPNALLHERKAGFRVDQSSPYPRVTVIQPGSPAALSGLMHGDELMEKTETPDALHLILLRYKRKVTLDMKLADDVNYFDKVIIERSPDPSPEQENAFQSWIKG